ncbi:MAG: outer membrane protein assembly factor BamD [Rhodospirillales bacterium]
MAALILTLAACAADDETPYVERPVHELYNSAKAMLDEGAYTQAAKAFDEVERQHPYSKWATKAQIMAAYSYYLDNDYDDAIIALDRFIQLNPSHRDVPYAYYLKGLSYYEQISTVDRDQAMTENALSTLNELLTRFPESTYSRDAKIKVELTYDSLAGKEMEIGRYYLFQRQYLAAINRFKRVVDEYQTTTHVPEALLRLTEAYTALGLDGEARKTASVLGHNFPGSEWYAEAYALVQGAPTPGEEPAGEPEESWYKFW